MLEREFKFYEDNKESLKAMHPKQFIVIVGEQVVGNFDTREESLRSAAKAHPLGTFLVQDTTQDQVVHRFHSRVRP